LSCAESSGVCLSLSTLHGARACLSRCAAGGDETRERLRLPCCAARPGEQSTETAGRSRCASRRRPASWRRPRGSVRPRRRQSASGIALNNANSPLPGLSRPRFESRHFARTWRPEELVRSGSCGSGLRWHWRWWRFGFVPLPAARQEPASKAAEILA